MPLPLADNKIDLKVVDSSGTITDYYIEVMGNVASNTQSGSGTPVVPTNPNSTIMGVSFTPQPTTAFTPNFSQSSPGPYAASFAHSVSAVVLTVNFATGIVGVSTRVSVNNTGYVQVAANGSSQPLALLTGINTVIVKISASNGTNYAYTFTLTRN